jgi:hypothetical protein
MTDPDPRANGFLIVSMFQETAAMLEGLTDIVTIAGVDGAGGGRAHGRRQQRRPHPGGRDAPAPCLVSDRCPTREVEKDDRPSR